MKKFFSKVIKQKVATILAVVFIIAFGIYSTLQMPINLLPDINVPMVCVQIIYPGANASSVEKDVTQKVEDGLSSISGITQVDSYSYDNLSAVVLSFDYGTDTNGKKADITSKLNGLDLPEGIISSVYDIDLNAEALAVLSVTDKQENLKDAYASAEELAAKIRAIDGVENVEIKGGPQTSFVIEPYGGLELAAPLIVQAFSYGELDIPLGNISSAGGNIQIRNNSDIKKEDDIRDMPVALPSSIVTLLTSVKSIMRYYENSTQEELQTLADDLDGGVLDVLQKIDQMSADELEKIAELRTYMNIAENFTYDQLSNFKTSRFYDDIYKAVTDEPAEEGGERTPKTDEELQDIVDELQDRYPLFSQYLTVDMLKVISQNKLGDVIAFREWLEQTEEYQTAKAGGEYYEFTDRDYIKLARDTGLYTTEGDDEISDSVDFAKKTSAAGLTQIADKKREAEENGESYNPSDGECALLFTGTELSAEHPIIMSSTFMAFVRNEDTYESNMQTLIEKRGEFGEEISAEQFGKIYDALDLTGVFEFKLSKDLFKFILNSDFSKLNPNGEFVARVDDIANIRTEDEFNSYVYFGGGKARVINGVILEVYKSNGANSSAVVEKVKSIYSSFLKSGHSGTAIKLLDDQSEFISDSISNVLVSMLIGGALAVLVIFVFLKKVRTSVIIAITMPLSVLASLICLYLMGITLNMVSLGGLAVGIGMLVDNSIVVIESITKHRERDKTAFEAAVDGTVEVGGALFGSTLTTVCVFIPIIFSGGLTGEIFTDLSWAVIFSLAFSLIVSVTVIPTLYSLVCGDKKQMLKGGKLSNDFVAEAADEAVAEQPATAEAVQTAEPEIPAQNDKKPKKQNKAKSFFRGLKEPKVMGAVTGFYGRILPKVLNRKLITILVAIVVFGASIGLLFLTGTEFLPSIDKGQIEINMSYDGTGKQLKEIEEDVLYFAETVSDNVENVDYVSVSVGKNGLLALTDTGIIKVQLTTNKNTQKTVEKIRKLAKDENLKPAGKVTVREIDGVVASLMSGAADMAVTVVGDDSETLAEIATEIAEKLEKNGFESVTTSVDSRATELDITFNRTKMAELGLDYQITVLTLRIGIASYTACRVTIDGEEYNLNVRFEGDAVATTNRLEDFVVGADSNGNAVKLKDIAQFKEISTATSIRRTDGKQMVSVSGVLPGVDTGTASKKMEELARKVLSSGDYAGYTFESSGITSYLNDAFAGLVVALVISFFLLYAVMAIQFGSFVKPLIIMASIPFSFTGGFIALVITGTSLNVVSFIGLIMLMGVVVNNAIVMLEKIKQLHDEGMNHYDAVREACKTRLRPILMTTLTTILALIPLAIGVGKGSELMQPLGIVVIGGLLIGTLVTLVLIPAVYCAVHRLSGKNKEKPEKRVKAKKKIKNA